MDMPDVAGAMVGRLQLKFMAGTAIAGVIEQQQPDARGVAAENGKVDAATVGVDASTQGQGPARRKLNQVLDG